MVNLHFLKFNYFFRLRDPLVQTDFSEGVKYLVYSAHDTTLSAALVAMNGTNLETFYSPYYSSGEFFS